MGLEVLRWGRGVGLEMGGGLAMVWTRFVGDWVRGGDPWRGRWGVRRVILWPREPRLKSPRSPREPFAFIPGGNWTANGGAMLPLAKDAPEELPDYRQGLSSKGVHFSLFSHETVDDDREQARRIALGTWVSRSAFKGVAEMTFASQNCEGIVAPWQSGVPTPENCRLGTRTTPRAVNNILWAAPVKSQSLIERLHTEE